MSIDRTLAAIEARLDAIADGLADVRVDYDPDQERAEDGKFGSGSGTGGGDKTEATAKPAPAAPASAAPKPAPADDDDGWDDDDLGSDDWMARMAARRTAKVQPTIDAIVAHPAVIAQSGDRKLMFVRSAEMSNPEEGAFRITVFDEDGPVGHTTGKSIEKLAEEIAIDWQPSRTEPADDDAVMAFTGTERFAAGSANVAKIQRANAGLKTDHQDTKKDTVPKPTNINQTLAAIDAITDGLADVRADYDPDQERAADGKFGSGGGGGKSAKPGKAAPKVSTRESRAAETAKPAVAKRIAADIKPAAAKYAALMARGMTTTAAAAMSGASREEIDEVTLAARAVDDASPAAAWHAVAGTKPDNDGKPAGRSKPTIVNKPAPAPEPARRPQHGNPVRKDSTMIEHTLHDLQLRCDRIDTLLRQLRALTGAIRQDYDPDQPRAEDGKFGSGPGTGGGGDKDKGGGKVAAAAGAPKSSGGGKGGKPKGGMFSEADRAAMAKGEKSQEARDLAVKGEVGGRAALAAKSSDGKPKGGSMFSEADRAAMTKGEQGQKDLNAAREAAAEKVRATATSLPDSPARYFKVEPNTPMVPVDKLLTIRAREKGIANASKHMANAYNGEGELRKPIDVSKNEDGTYSVEDGNSTTAIALRNGWKEMPVNIVPATPEGRAIFRERKTGESLSQIKALQDAGKLSKDVPLEQHRAIAEEVLAKHAATVGESISRLSDAVGIPVEGRVKKLDSALGKIARKPYDEAKGTGYKTAADLADVTGLRFITKDVEGTRAALAAIQDKYELAEPPTDYLEKGNDGYRALHLSIIDKDGLVKEVQIQTPRQRAFQAWSHDVYKPQTAEQDAAVGTSDKPGPLREKTLAYGNKVSDHFYALDSGKEVAGEIPEPDDPEISRLFGTVSGMYSKLYGSKK